MRQEQRVAVLYLNDRKLIAAGFFALHIELPLLSQAPKGPKASSHGRKPVDNSGPHSSQPR